jgi:hypothetical protein
LLPPIECLDAPGTEAMPFTAGGHDNSPLLLVHQVHGDTGVTNSGAMQSFQIPAEFSYDLFWSDDNGGLLNGNTAFFSQLLGGNYLSFGRSANTAKSFEVGGPDYTGSSDIALWSYSANESEGTYYNNLNFGHADINSGNCPGPTDLYFYNSTNGTQGPAVVNAHFNSTGDIFAVPVTAGGFASRATNAGQIAESGWTNNTAVNCIAYVSGTGINITNVDSSGNCYMTNSGITGTVTIFMQPGASLQTKGASGSYHAE